MSRVCDGTCKFGEWIDASRIRCRWTTVYPASIPNVPLTLIMDVTGEVNVPCACHEKRPFVVANPGIYKMRNGDIAVVVAQKPGGWWVGWVRASFNDDTSRTWCATGSYDGSEAPNPEDLVEFLGMLPEDRK